MVWGPIVYGPDPLAYEESTGPKLKEARAQARSMEPKEAQKYGRGLHSPRQIRGPVDDGGIQVNLEDQKISQGNCP